MVSQHVKDVTSAAYASWADKQDLAEFRAGYDAMLPATGPDVAVSQDSVGGVSGEWIDVPESSDTTIVFLHGGGYFVGSAQGYRGLVSRLAKASAARAFTVDYSLAPEAPFPAAYNEAQAVYRALVGEFGVDPARLAVVGDSAGGGLALALLVGLRDGGHPLPACYVGMSPMVDLTLSGDTFDTLSDVDHLINKDLSMQSSALYRGDVDAADTRISPLFADLSDLPPMLVQVGTTEVLLADSIRLAEKARNAGVKVDLQVAYEMVHAYQLFCEHLAEADAALTRIGTYIKQHAGG
jgi:acetyl esterase/lipase